MRGRVHKKFRKRLLTRGHLVANGVLQVNPDAEEFYLRSELLTSHVDKLSRLGTSIVATWT
jgi:hypothetical protein